MGCEVLRAHRGSCGRDVYHNVRDDMITRKAILDKTGPIRILSGDKGNPGSKRLAFEMLVPFGAFLCNKDDAGTGLGIDMLNNRVDDFVEDGYLLNDIIYTPVGVEGDKIVIAVNADMEEWLEGE